LPPKNLPSQCHQQKNLEIRFLTHELGAHLKQTDAGLQKEAPKRNRKRGAVLWMEVTY
jgi:hypothetical protein